jgi:hypothetical protein
VAITVGKLKVHGRWCLVYYQLFTLSSTLAFSERTSFTVQKVANSKIGGTNSKIEVVNLKIMWANSKTLN